MITLIINFFLTVEVYYFFISCYRVVEIYMATILSTLVWKPMANLTGFF